MRVLSRSTAFRVVGSSSSAVLRAVAAATIIVGGTAPAAGAGKASPAVPALRVQIDKSKVDLKEHRVELRMSRPAGKVKITVFSQSEAVIAEQEHDFTGQAAGALLVATWAPNSEAPVDRIEIRAADAQGLSSWFGVLSPWFIPVPHVDVNFKTGSSEILPDEVPKLEEALTKIKEVLAKEAAHGRMHAGLALFIAGHTDTVGNNGHNLKLSQERARAIAGWFRKNGVRLPIAYEGFGETALAVKTADDVDEIRNRRADYILSDADPSMKTTGFRPVWKRIK